MRALVLLLSVTCTAGCGGPDSPTPSPDPARKSSGDAGPSLEQRVAHLERLVPDDGPDFAKIPGDEQRVAQLERLVQQLQQRIAQLEARLTATPAKAPRNASPADWRDKGSWRRLRKDMTMDEVSALIGEPEKVSAQTYTIYWYWGYPGGAQVTFDAESNLVDGWSEP